MFLIKCQPRQLGNRSVYLNGSFNSDLNMSIRQFQTTSVNLDLDYYEALGLTKSATQQDVKAAYYQLSMKYHPDKNKGSDVAVEKFRDIKTAYEVLGNLRLRKLYDKGIIHTAGSQFHQPKEDDAQTKFYKSRMKRSEVPNTAGRTQIYDFDEWSRAHYGRSFQRKKTAKENFEAKEVKKVNFKLGFQNEMTLLGLVACIIIIAWVAFSEQLDIDKTIEIDKRKKTKN